MHRLPSRIAAVMIGTILIFVLTVSGAILWMTHALDLQARDRSLAQVDHEIDNQLENVALLVLDYAKWDTAVRALEMQDMIWFQDNVGASATVGKALQLVAVWGGPLAVDLAWAENGVEEGRTGLLDPALISVTEARLAPVTVGSYDGVEFFAWHGGELFAMGAARLEIVDEVAVSRATADDAPRLLMGRRLTERTLTEIAQGFDLTELEIVRDRPDGQPFASLLGGDGEPVAYLTWNMPHPGRAVLWQMLLPLVTILLMTVALVAAGMAMIRRSARHLVVAEQASAEAARTDALTGLPNRAAFNEAVAAPARAGERAILFLDVDDFKRINDSIGHAIGDAVIAHLGQRLRSLCGPDRFLARIGGDEFVFVLTGPGAGDRVAALAAEVNDLLVAPFEIAGHRFRLGTSIGYAVQAKEGMSGEDLVRQADLAMYEAKRQRDQGPIAFGALIEQADRDARALEQALRQALTREGELFIAYQPISKLGARQLVRAEALARWRSAELGFVPPDRFIAVAEQSGLIVELGQKLFRLICDDLERHPDLEVSFNVSPLQLMAPSFVPDLIAELRRRGIDPSRLEVELTERVVVDDPQLAAERLGELHAAGFSIALDDFGKGYSSIGYLRQMAFDTLKIDRSFVTGLQDAPERLALVNAMIRLAHALELRVVCEGIETGEELDLLRNLGCDLAQGYHLDRPMPIDSLVGRWGPTEDRVAVA